MKYFLVAACLWSLNATAQEACSSVWIFKANKTCSHISNGPDNTQPGTIKTITDWSPRVRGGKDQLQICREVRDSYNARFATLGHVAELAKSGPTNEQKDKDVVGKVTYIYQCEMNVTIYPGKVAASPACGTEDKWSYQVEGAKPAGASCLSCDQLQAAAPEAMVECLKNSITQVITPKAIDLRDGDIAAVKAQAKRMLKINKDYRAISNLQSPKDLSVFIDFVEQQ